LETLDKLIVEANYMLEQIFNINESSITWKRTPEWTMIHKETKSMPGYKICVVNSMISHNDEIA
jgi:hypothetical protein